MIRSQVVAFASPDEARRMCNAYCAEEQLIDGDGRFLATVRNSDGLVSRRLCRDKHACDDFIASTVQAISP